MNANPSPDGQAIRRRRQALGLSVTALAERMQCSTQYLSQIETGARKGCSPAVFARLCDALGVPAGERDSLRVDIERTAA